MAKFLSLLAAAVSIIGTDAIKFLQQHKQALQPVSRKSVSLAHRRRFSKRSSSKKFAAQLNAIFHNVKSKSFKKMKKSFKSRAGKHALKLKKKDDHDECAFPDSPEGFKNMFCRSPPVGSEYKGSDCGTCPEILMEAVMMDHAISLEDATMVCEKACATFGDCLFDAAGSASMMLQKSMKSTKKMMSKKASMTKKSQKSLLNKKTKKHYPGYNDYDMGPMGYEGPANDWVAEEPYYDMRHGPEDMYDPASMGHYDMYHEPHYHPAEMGPYDMPPYDMYHGPEDMHYPAAEIPHDMGHHDMYTGPEEHYDMHPPHHHPAPHHGPYPEEYHYGPEPYYPEYMHHPHGPYEEYHEPHYHHDRPPHYHEPHYHPEDDHHDGPPEEILDKCFDRHFEPLVYALPEHHFPKEDEYHPIPEAGEADYFDGDHLKIGHDESATEPDMYEEPMPPTHPEAPVNANYAVPEPIGRYSGPMMDPPMPPMEPATTAPMMPAGYEDGPGSVYPDMPPMEPAMGSMPMEPAMPPSDVDVPPVSTEAPMMPGDAAPMTAADGTMEDPALAPMTAPAPMVSLLKSKKAKAA